MNQVYRRPYLLAGVTLALFILAASSPMAAGPFSLSLSFIEQSNAFPLTLPHRTTSAHRPVKQLNYGFQSRKSAWFKPGTPSSNAGIYIPFAVKNETSWSCRACSVEGGVPFPIGEVNQLDQLELADAKGEPVPFQPKILTRWPDGSIKWAGLYFLTDLAPGQGSGFFLIYGAAHNKSQDSIDKSSRSFNEEPLRIRNNPYWIDATGVFGRLYPVTARFATEEKMLDAFFDQVDHAPSEELQVGALLQFARTGAGKYFELGRRHAAGGSVAGLLYYYYLTGDESALDAAKKIGESFLDAAHPATPQVLWGTVLLYETTGDERYKNAADAMIEIYLKDQPPADRSGAVLRALISYHELTQDEEVREMLLKLVRGQGASVGAMQGNAYAYFLTGDKNFIKNLHQGMDELLQNPQVSTSYLSTIPYAFEAMEAASDK